MSVFVQQVLDGLGSGAIYAMIGLSLVLIFKTLGHINFAQGEMALFCAYITWTLTQISIPPLLALVGGVVAGFALGGITERISIRPFYGKRDLVLVTATLGLFLAFNGLTQLIWNPEIKTMPSVLPSGVVNIGGIPVSVGSLSLIALILVLWGCLALAFKKTQLGLSIRAVASNSVSSSLMGVDVRRVRTLGWGLASALGALAAILVAPKLFLTPVMMFDPLVFAFAGLALGGLDSFGGAVFGCMFVGVAQNLAGTYVPGIGGDLQILVPLALIIAVLLVRPSGLFGGIEVRRV